MGSGGAIANGSGDRGVAQGDDSCRDHLAGAENSLPPFLATTAGQGVSVKKQGRRRDRSTEAENSRPPGFVTLAIGRDVSAENARREAEHTLPLLLAGAVPGWRRLEERCRRERSTGAEHTLLLGFGKACKDQDRFG